MQPRTIDECLGWISRFPLIRSIHEDAEWLEHMRHPERGVLNGWLAWDIPQYNDAVAALELSLAVLSEGSPELLDHYITELRSRRTWRAFWGVRSEIYVATWLAGRGFAVRPAEHSGRGKADLVASCAGGGEMTIEVSNCFAPGDEAHLQRLWDLELRIRRLGIPAFIDLHDAPPASGQDSAQIAERLAETARRLGDAVGEHKLRVDREQMEWVVHVEPLETAGPFTETAIALPPLLSHIDGRRLARKLCDERGQLPDVGTNVICLDMSHVSDWYCVQLLNRSLPFAQHLDELSPTVSTFLGRTDRGSRVAAVLVFVRDLHRTDLGERLAFWRREGMACSALAHLVDRWSARDVDDGPSSLPH